MPDGGGVPAGGAAWAGARGNTFPPAGARFDEASGEGELRFAGQVTFSGHFGMLSMQIAHPWIGESDPLDPFVAALDRGAIEQDATIVG